MADWRRAWRYLDRAPEVVRCLALARRPLGLIERYLRLAPWPGPHCIEPVRGVVIDVETYEDLVTAWIIFYRQEYALPTGVRTVVDLGANIGCFTLQAALRYPAVRIVAYEPMPATFARLEHTIRINELGDRVSARQVGAAATAGPRLIPDADAPSQSLGMLPQGAAAAPGTTIACESLGGLVADAAASLGGTIDLLKIDIEGAEHEAFEAATPEELKPVREIVMEYHPNAPKAGLFAALGRCGFRPARDRIIDPGTGIAHFTRSEPSGS